MSEKIEAGGCKEAQWHDVSTLQDGIQCQRTEICARVHCKKQDCSGVRVRSEYSDDDDEKKKAPVRIRACDIHSDSYVCRCFNCDNDFPSYDTRDCICESCEDAGFEQFNIGMREEIGAARIRWMAGRLENGLSIPDDFFRYFLQMIESISDIEDAVIRTAAADQVFGIYGLTIMDRRRDLQSYVKPRE